VIAPDENDADALPPESALRRPNPSLSVRSQNVSKSIVEALRGWN